MGMATDKWILCFDIAMEKTDPKKVLHACEREAGT
jgi:hypothetical protein